MIVKLGLYGWVGYKQINVESCSFQEQRGKAGRYKAMETSRGHHIGQL